MLFNCLADVAKVFSNILQTKADICILFYLLVSLVFVEVDQLYAIFWGITRIEWNEQWWTYKPYPSEFFERADQNIQFT